MDNCRRDHLLVSAEFVYHWRYFAPCLNVFAVSLSENQIQDAVLGLKVRHETNRAFLQKRIQQLLQQQQDQQHGGNSGDADVQAE